MNILYTKSGFSLTEKVAHGYEHTSVHEASDRERIDDGTINFKS
jgi:hypothetical protein